MAAPSAAVGDQMRIRLEGESRGIDADQGFRGHGQLAWPQRKARRNRMTSKGTEPRAARPAKDDGLVFYSLNKETNRHRVQRALGDRDAAPPFHLYEMKGSTACPWFARAVTEL